MSPNPDMGASAAHAPGRDGRVALFIPSLHGGGAERVMVSLANGLARRGLAVDLVLVRDEGIYRRDVDAGVRVMSLDGRRTLGAAAPLAAYLRRERPQVMMSAMNYANVVSSWARRLSGVPLRLVLSEHANLSQALADAGPLVSRALPWLMRRAYASADAVVAVSGGVADDLAAILRYPRDRIVTRHNPIETGVLRRKGAEPPPHPWFAPGEPPVVLGAGRLGPEKDFPTLIEAFGILRGAMPARLAILGEGAQRPALEARIARSPYAGDILLAGFQDNPYRWMSRAAVFALSSRWEGFGNVLVEAMACGTPVVSTDSPGGPAEILEHGRWGRLVPVGDAPALADALRRTLADAAPPDVARRAEDFSVERALDAYLRVLYPAHAAPDQS